MSICNEKYSVPACPTNVVISGDTERALQYKRQYILGGATGGKGVVIRLLHEWYSKDGARFFRGGDYLGRLEFFPSPSRSFRMVGDWKGGKGGNVGGKVSLVKNHPSTGHILLGEIGMRLSLCI